MNKQSISNATARRLVLNSQLFDRTGKSPHGKEGVLQVIDHLGYVQIDAVGVVDRAHNLTLLTRLLDFKRESLTELQRERRIFEYWGHALSYLPMSDYRFSLPLMKRHFDPIGKWEKDRFDKYGHLMKPVLKRLREEGPLTTKDFASLPTDKRHPDMNPKPLKAALEMLFWRGEVMISERRNFQRLFDLTERVLPSGIDLRVPNDDELGRHLVRRALQAYGVAREIEIRKHIQGAGKSVITKALHQMVEEGTVVQVDVEGIDKSGYYSLVDRIDGADKEVDVACEVHLLSPFDNLIIQRDRARDLFNFDYTMEIYVPAAKRKYGYYVMPVLWGDRFVARFDSKVDKKAKKLVIHNLVFEDDFNEFEQFAQPFRTKLAELATFVECEEVEYGEFGKILQ